jgi:hypothetical protein
LDETTFYFIVEFGVSPTEVYFEHGSRKAPDRVILLGQVIDDIQRRFGDEIVFTRIIVAEVLA